MSICDQAPLATYRVIVLPAKKSIVQPVQQPSPPRPPLSCFSKKRGMSPRTQGVAAQGNPKWPSMLRAAELWITTRAWASVDGSVGWFVEQACSPVFACLLLVACCLLLVACCLLCARSARPSLSLPCSTSHQATSLELLPALPALPHPPPRAGSRPR